MPEVGPKRKSLKSGIPGNLLETGQIDVVVTGGIDQGPHGQAGNHLDDVMSVD
jgi:hypothetical protein